MSPLPDPSPADQEVIRYLKPIAWKALELWYGDTFICLPSLLKAALAVDVAGIMIEEGILPSTHIAVVVAVMLLDLRIYPAGLRAYAECIV